MIKRLINVKVSLSEGNSSLVISRLLIENISIKNIASKENTTFILSYEDLPALRRAVRKSGCRVSLTSEGRAYKIYFYMIENKYSIAAFLLSVFIFLHAFQYIWSVEMTGANPEIRDEALEVLKEKGIKPGVRHSDILLNQQSASILYKEIEQLSWSGFERKGSKLIVTLREKDFLEKIESDQLAHLAASKTGTIQTLNVSAGTPLVKSGDVVKRGEILVSGYIGREGFEKGTRAEGSVKALTWYTVSVSMPVNHKIKKITGHTHSEYALRFKNFQTPFVSYKKNPFKNQIKQSTDQTLSLFGFNLPLELVEEKYKEVSELETGFSDEQYINVLKMIAEKNVLSNTDGSGQILENKILHEDIENGKVKLTIFYEVLENIAATKPFTEETRE